MISKYEVLSKENCSINISKNFTRLRERWSFENLKELKEYEDEIKFVGRKGDYIIINTALCMHRASIPSNFRDMAQITIKPRWRSV